MPCPDENALLDFARGLLREGQALEVERHLDGCDGCRALMAEATGGPVRTPPLGGTQPDEPPAFFPKLGRYAVLELISAGGMGVVYAAYDPELDRKVALKVLRPESRGIESLEQAQGRLLREAKAMARLAHPNIVAVHDAGMVGDQVFVAMELVEGGTLAEWLRARHHEWPEILEVFLQAGRGLAAAHAAGIVHRDFKPDNVLLGRDGRARVTDFGLACPVALGVPGTASDRPTPGASSRTLAGTPAYMSPEQFAGREVGARSDQFSFCVALWEGLYGRRPFGGATLAELSAAVGAGHLPPAPQGSPVPAWLHRALARGLSTDSDGRFPFLEGLLAALSRSTALRRRRAWLAAIALALLTAAAAAFTQFAQAGAARCQIASRGFSESWSPARQQALRDTVLATKVPYAQQAWEGFAQHVEERSRVWAAASQTQCEDGERESSCLELQLLELEALLKRLSRTDAHTVERIALLGGEPDAPCPVAEGALNPEARRALGLLARARAEHLAAGPARALPIAVEAQIALQRSGDRWLGAYGLLLLSTIEAEAGFGARAEATAVSASVAAEATGSPALAAMAWVQRIVAARARHLSLGEAEEHARHAFAFLENSGGDPAVEAQLLGALGEIALDHGEAARAALLFGQEIKLRRAAAATSGAGLGTAYARQALALAAQGKRRDAIEADRTALELLEATLGAGHPRAAVAKLTLGEDLLALGLVQEARGVFEAASASLGPSGEHGCITARAEAGAGHALSVLDAWPAAIECVERALTRNLGSCPALKLGLLLDLGEKLRREERHSEAATAFTDAARLAINLGLKAQAASAHLGLGWCRLALDQSSEAIAPLEAALQEMEGREREARLVREALAAALWKRGGDRGRARAMARAAGIPLERLKAFAPPRGSSPLVFAAFPEPSAHQSEFAAPPLAGGGDAP